MAYVTPDKYSPYPRVCDICGQLRSISTMRKLDGQTFVCDRHQGERTRIMLDTLNAHARPPQTWPNKDAKPQNPEYPNTLESDEGATLNFIDRQIQAQCRYELIESGSGPYYSAGGAIPAMAWSARYLYGLIVEGKRTAMLARARVLLAQAADYLMTRQYGFGLIPTATRATNAFYGAVLEPGASVFVTDDVSASGLALLYAYRLFGTATYLIGARAAASYLRNVQAIGKNGTNYTASNAAGTSRLYTGSLASQVSTTAGMYSDSAFYPSALIALEFWNELTTTDGDQDIGATAIVTGFDSAPNQLMSTSRADLRTCWADGIRDAEAELINGLSSITPREFFNAYPATKTQFTTIGTGMWEYADGPDSTGTQISSQNFARALSHLYAYEGATSQITTILAWLRTFVSNENFETPDNTSPSVLLRSTTGEYDPTETLATTLTVRDADDNFAATATNGSSIYDWGAFGLLSSLLAASNMTSFKTSRLGALNVRQRYRDGTANDGLNYDRIELRGKSGLSFQTGFRTYVTTFGNFDAISTSPDPVTTRYWFEASSGVTANASNQVSAWADLTGNGWDLHTPSGGNTPPTLVLNSTQGLPGIYFGNPIGGGPGDWSLVHYGGPFYTGAPAAFPAGTPYPFTANEPHIVYAVVKPTVGAPPGGGVSGGMIVADRKDFSRQFWTLGATQQRLARNAGLAILYENPAVTYIGSVILIAYRWTGTEMFMSVNGGSEVPTTDLLSGLSTSAFPAVADDANNHVLMVGGSNVDQSGFQGLFYAVMLAADEKRNPTTMSYLAGRYGDAVASITNDAVLASQYGLNFRGAK